jgi:hypothetical protein
MIPIEALSRIGRNMDFESSFFRTNWPLGGPSARSDERHLGLTSLMHVRTKPAGVVR